MRTREDQIIDQIHDLDRRIRDYRRADVNAGYQELQRDVLQRELDALHAAQRAAAEAQRRAALEAVLLPRHPDRVWVQRTCALHLVQLAFDGPVMLVRELNPSKAWSIRELAKAGVPNCSSEETYAVGLHECGHVLAANGSGFSHRYVLSASSCISPMGETVAWRWAIDRASAGPTACNGTWSTKSAPIAVARRSTKKVHRRRHRVRLVEAAARARHVRRSMRPLGNPPARNESAAILRAVRAAHAEDGHHHRAGTPTRLHLGGTNHERSDLPGHRGPPPGRRPDATLDAIIAAKDETIALLRQALAAVNRRVDTQDEIITSLRTTRLALEETVEALTIERRELYARHMAIDAHATALLADVEAGLELMPRTTADREAKLAAIHAGVA